MTEGRPRPPSERFQVVVDGGTHVSGVPLGGGYRITADAGAWRLWLTLPPTDALRMAAALAAWGRRALEDTD